MFTLTPTFQVKKPTVYVPKQSVDLKSQLQTMGKDTSELDRKVEQEIEETKTNTRTFNEFKDSLKKASTDMPDKSREEIYVGILNSYKNRGISIEGVNIDEELSAFGVQGQDIQTQTQTEEAPVVEEKGQNRIMKGLSSIDKSIQSAGETIIDTGLAGLTKLPEIAGDAASGIMRISKVINPYSYINPEKAKEGDEVAQALQEAGINTTDKLQEIIGIDPDALTTKIGEGGAEILALFTHDPTRKLTTISKVAGKSDEAIKGMVKLKEKAPGVFNAIKNKLLKDDLGIKMLQGAKEAGKYGLVSEGETSLGEMAGGAIVNPVLSKAGTQFQKLTPFSGTAEQLLRKITSLSKSQLKKYGSKTINQDAAIGVQTLKNFGQGNVENSKEGIYNAFKQRMRDIYSKEINPNLEKAGKITESIAGSTDDVLKSMSSSIGDKKVYKGFIGDQEIKKLTTAADEIKGLESKVSSFEEMEMLKQFTSSLSRSTDDKAMQTFYGKVSENIQNKMDSLLEGKGLESLSKLKREYFALSNLTSTLDTKVAQEIRQSGDDIVTQFGVFTTVMKLAKGDIEGAAQSLTATKLVGFLRDDKTLINKMFQKIYGKDNIDNLIKVISQKGGAGIGGSNIGGYLTEPVE